MSSKYDWTEEFRKGCEETGKRVKENNFRRIKEKDSLEGDSLFVEEIKKYLLKGGTIKVHPSLSSIPTYDLNKDDSEYDARPERGYALS